MLSLIALAAARCAELKAQSSPKLEITSASGEAGACRITGFAHPLPGSRIGFELRMPETGWTGRYVQLGTGGFAGTLFPETIAAEAQRGNAAAMTDSGHQGDRMSAAWAAGNPQALRDYGFASIKATSDAAHRLIRAYYDRPARWRYFVGCSNGGRQALMAAQRYPHDWDGILAGSPANPWTEQLYRLASLQHALAGLGAESLIPKLPAIQQAALASCSPGTVRKGVATDPLLCPFRLETAGLAPREITAVRTIVDAGYEPTSAAQSDGWAQWILGAGAGQIAFAEQAFRYLLQDNPRWTLSDFDAASARQAAQRWSATLDVAPDFRRFQAKGGKIVSYFGWADSLIAPRLALDFFHRAQPAPDYYRLFMIPGMGHCQGGVGPVNFGQSVDAAARNPEPRYDVRAALVAWVERGQPPDSLTAVSTDDQTELRPTQ